MRWPTHWILRLGRSASVLTILNFCCVRGAIVVSQKEKKDKVLRERVIRFSASLLRPTGSVPATLSMAHEKYRRTGHQFTSSSVIIRPDRPISQYDFRSHLKSRAGSWPNSGYQWYLRQYFIFPRGRIQLSIGSADASEPQDILYSRIIDCRSIVIGRVSLLLVVLRHFSVY